MFVIGYLETRYIEKCEGHGDEGEQGMNGKV
jgi:hypothetical protein